MNNVNSSTEELMSNMFGFDSVSHHRQLEKKNWIIVLCSSCNHRCWLIRNVPDSSATYGQRCRSAQRINIDISRLILLTLKYLSFEFRHGRCFIFRYCSNFGFFNRSRLLRFRHGPFARGNRNLEANWGFARAVKAVIDCRAMGTAACLGSSSSDLAAPCSTKILTCWKTVTASLKTDPQHHCGLPQAWRRMA